MKNVKRIAALLLALVMVFALCACSDSGSGKDKNKDDKVEKVEKKTDAELIVGTWEAKLDMGEYFDMLMDSDPEMALMAAYFDFSGVELAVNYEFDKDGSYQLSFSVADEEKLKMVLRKAIEKVVNDMLAGTGYTIEEAAAEEGMTVDAFFDAMLEEIGFDSQELLSDSNESGSYVIKDGKLYFAEDGDDIDEDDYVEYKLKGDKLTFVEEYEDGELTDDTGAIFPLDFVRK